MPGFDYTADALERAKIEAQTDGWAEVQRRVLSLIASSQQILGKSPPELIGVTSNAFRLFADAEHLASSGRFASALSLAVLGLEEVGKLILLSWKQLDPEFHQTGSAHDKKQMAVASMLVARTFQQVLADMPETLSATDPAALALASAALSESGVLDDVVEIIGGDLNSKKKLGFYFDFDRDPEEGVGGPAEMLDVEHVVMQGKFALGGLLDRRATNASLMICRALAPHRSNGR